MSGLAWACGGNVTTTNRTFDGTSTSTSTATSTKTSTTTHEGGGGAGGSDSLCPTSDSQAACEALCPDVVAAGCDKGPDMANCVESCQALNGLGCPEWGGFVDCLGDSPTWECDKDGKVAAKGCTIGCIQPCLDQLGGTDGQGN